MNQLQKLNQFVNQTREKSCSVLVTYNGGENPIKATIGTTQVDAMSVEGVSLYDTMTDFIIGVDQLESAPKNGDVIAYDGKTYTCLPLAYAAMGKKGSEPCWSYTCGELAYRIHTKDLGDNESLEAE